MSRASNGLFLVAFMKGVLSLPSSLEPVHAVEPKLYHYIGVGLVKRLVSTPMWPMLCGMEPPPKPSSRQGFLVRTELSTKGAEVCHGATFLLALSVALFLLTSGRNSAAVWILAFNFALNGYPVMLQRSNRWRIQRIQQARGN